GRRACARRSGRRRSRAELDRRERGGAGPWADGHGRRSRRGHADRGDADAHVARRHRVQFAVPGSSRRDGWPGLPPHARGAGSARRESLRAPGARARDPLRTCGGGALQIRSCGPVVTPRANRGGNGGDVSSPPLFRRCGRVVTPRANRGGNGGDASSPPFVIILSAAAFTHVVISGLATGSIYALMALALVIVYNATRTLNFAQGEMLMVSAFLAWTAQRTLGLSWWASIVIAIAGGALL